MDFRINNDDVAKDRGWLTLPSGIKKRIITTAGWDLKVEWEDGSSSWIPLKVLKE